MRILLYLGLLAPLAGCTMASMAGFDSLAMRPDGEVIDITGVPAWKDGSFMVGTTRGVVRRVAQSDALGWAHDGIGSQFDTVEYGVAARYGRVAFEIMRADLGGLVEGRCGYSREEIRDRIGGIGLAAPLSPLRLWCEYRINGRDAGILQLDAVEGDRATVAEMRSGWINLNGRELRLRSQHEVEGVRSLLGEPMGYVMATAQNRTIGAIELTGGQSHRAVIPRIQGDRAAALVAAITLGLFWDPGDVG